MDDIIINKQYFDNMYARSQDPWNFTTSAYEREKYQQTLRALSGKNFGNAIEIGCSIGVLTGQLATVCSAILGVDISEQPIMVARERLEDVPGARFEVLTIPQEFPDEKFDLIVISEVAYYLSREDLVLTRELVYNALPTAGTLCLVHWRPQIDGCVFNGDEVNAYFMELEGLKQSFQLINDRYRIDVLEKVSPTD